MPLRQRARITTTPLAPGPLAAVHGLRLQKNRDCRNLGRTRRSMNNAVLPAKVSKRRTAGKYAILRGTPCNPSTGRLSQNTASSPHAAAMAQFRQIKLGNTALGTNKLRNILQKRVSCGGGIIRNMLLCP